MRKNKRIKKIATINKQIRCCYGISSLCKNGQHVFMIDYDNKKLNDVIKHLKYIQKDYNLSEIYIIKSTNGYNAISLDMLPLVVIYSIGTNDFSIADRKFFSYGLKQGFYTLRFGKDKELIKILHSVSNCHNKSLGHKMFLEWFFNLNIDNNINFTENDNINILQFKSNKYGFHMVDLNVEPKQL